MEELYVRCSGYRSIVDEVVGQSAKAIRSGIDYDGNVRIILVLKSYAPQNNTSLVPDVGPRSFGWRSQMVDVAIFMKMNKLRTI